MRGYLEHRAIPDSVTFYRWKPLLFKRRTILDDAGNSVELFDPFQVDRSAKDADPGLADLANRVRATTQGKGDFPQLLTTIVTIFGIPLTGLIANRLGVPQWILLLVYLPSMWLLMRWAIRSTLHDKQEAVLATVLGDGRCGSCGYVINKLPPDDQGIIRCSECSSCWRQDALGEATADTPEIAPFWQPDPGHNTLTDAAGRIMRYPAYELSDDPDVQAALKNVVARNRVNRGCLAASVMLGALCMTGVGVLYALYTRVTSLSAALNLIIPLIFIAGGVILCRQAWHIYRGRSKVTSRDVSHRLIRIDRCPACLGKLVIPKDADPTDRRCQHCTATWDLWHLPT